MDSETKWMFLSLLEHPNLAPVLQHQMLTWAKARGDIGILAALAGYGDLLPEIDQELAKSQDAKVLASWIKRPGRTHEQCLALVAKEKRTKPLSAVAALADLDPEVYCKVLANTSSWKVPLVLLENASAPAQIHRAALFAFAALMGEQWPPQDTTTTVFQTLKANPRWLDDFITSTTNIDLIVAAMGVGGVGRSAAEYAVALAVAKVGQALSGLKPKATPPDLEWVMWFVPYLSNHSEVTKEMVDHLTAAIKAIEDAHRLAGEAVIASNYKSVWKQMRKSYAAKVASVKIADCLAKATSFADLTRLVMDFKATGASVTKPVLEQILANPRAADNLQATHALLLTAKSETVDFGDLAKLMEPIAGPAGVAEVLLAHRWTIHDEAIDGMKEPGQVFLAMMQSPLCDFANMAYLMESRHFRVAEIGAYSCRIFTVRRKPLEVSVALANKLAKHLVTAEQWVIFEAHLSDFHGSVDELLHVAAAQGVIGRADTSASTGNTQ